MNLLKDFRKNERGTSMAEFAVVATFFFMLIFGIIEFSRFLYTHNALTDAARRGARYAVIHRSDQVDGSGNSIAAKCVKNVIMYGETHISAYPACNPNVGQPVLINGIAAATITVQYDGVDLDGVPSSPNPYGTNLGTATVTITGFVFNISIPLFHRGVTLPPYTTTLPAESAGFEPDPI
jgi:Flp pilus assembly protein TadG